MRDRRMANWVPALAVVAVVQAQTFSVLHSFSGAGGRYPYAGVVQDAAGNLYGTTYAGGSHAGVVFKLDSAGNETVLYKFTGGLDGGRPWGGVIRDSAGNLYGTTSSDGLCSGCGVVFKLDTSGAETVLYSFTGGADGASPQAGLIRDSAGHLYGTTYYGGASGAGVYFKVDTSNLETVLYSFTGGADGGNPDAGLIRDAAGNLYGTTSVGGTCGYCGNVVKLDPAGQLTVLWLASGANGVMPMASVIRDSAGNLYGTTEYGGISGGPCGTLGCGVVFKIDPTGKQTVLYSFTGGADGAVPVANLVRDPAGNLYGTTYAGGNTTGVCATIGRMKIIGCGVVFKVDPTGIETVLHIFSGGADGASSSANLIRDSAGNLYGTARYGGAGNAGVVFKVAP